MLNQVPRPLPPEKDQVYPSSSRSTEQMRKLHPAEEGMQLLPRRPAAAGRAKTQAFQDPDWRW